MLTPFFPLCGCSEHVHMGHGLQDSVRALVAVVKLILYKTFAPSVALIHSNDSSLLLLFLSAVGSAQALCCLNPTAEQCFRLVRQEG
jgi:hypothetical protein